MRLLLATMLSIEPGFRVTAEASDGKEAVAMAEEGDCPDVLLLDLNMPHMDGYDVIRRLRESCPQLTIVVYSGEDERAGRAKVGGIGDYEYVVKGDPNKLIARLREICAAITTNSGREQ